MGLDFRVIPTNSNTTSLNLFVMMSLKDNRATTSIVTVFSPNYNLVFKQRPSYIRTVCKRTYLCIYI